MSNLLYPAFRAEDQELAEQDTGTVIGPPAFASPDPATAGYFLAPVEKHPGDLSDDYGQSHADVHVDGPDNAMTVGAGTSGGASEPNLPDNRDDWSKDNWKAAAQHYGLRTGGSKADLQARVEDHEEQVGADKEMSAEDWINAIDAAADDDDLTELRRRYTASGASYTTVESAFADASDEQ